MVSISNRIIYCLFTFPITFCEVDALWKRGPQEIKFILVYFSTILYEQWLDASPLVPPVP